MPIGTTFHLNFEVSYNGGVTWVGGGSAIFAPFDNPAMVVAAGRSILPTLSAPFPSTITHIRGNVVVTGNPYITGITVG